MTLTPVNESTLKAMTDAIVAEVQPEKVILFGSHARGDAKPDSDVDFVVIENQDLNEGDKRLREYSRIRLALMSFIVPMDILVYSLAEVARWGDSINHVLARALREGRVLYERS